MFEISVLEPIQRELEEYLASLGGYESTPVSLAPYACSCSGGCEGGCEASCSGRCSGCGKS